MKKSLRDFALSCLLEDDLRTKIAKTQDCYMALKNDQLEINSNIRFTSQQIKPGQPEKPELVAPQLVAKRSISTQEGKMALIHAIAHIEFNAINLAWDAVCRFPDMPVQYYLDWAQIAYEESLHFQLLEDYLHEFGTYYGAYTAHDGLWQMAEKTSGDILERMAIVPRVLEARGLDVTPGMIKRFESIGDIKIVTILQKIYQDEIGHVETGSKWFRYLCQQRNLQPSIVFPQIIDKYFNMNLRGPFNLSARQQAGFTDQEIAWLETVQAE